MLKHLGDIIWAIVIAVIWGVCIYLLWILFTTYGIGEHP